MLKINISAQIFFIFFHCIKLLDFIDSFFAQLYNFSCFGFIIRGGAEGFSILLISVLTVSVPKNSFCTENVVIVDFSSSNIDTDKKFDIISANDEQSIYEAVKLMNRRYKISKFTFVGDYKFQCGAQCARDKIIATDVTLGLIFQF